MLMSDAHTLNQVILSLYREGREVPLDTFHAWALEQIRCLIAFDSAAWGNVVAHPPELHEVYLHNCGPGFVAAYRACMRQDTFSAELLARPGVTVNLGDLTTRALYVRTPLYRQFARHYQVEWVLGTLLYEPIASLCEFLGLWRHDPGRPFSEAERQTKELLMPHLVEVHRGVRLRHFLKGDIGHQREWALVDAHGLLREASPAFVARLRTQWPGWSGSYLPEALASCVREGSGYAAQGIRLDVTPYESLRYVVGRPAGALERLSRREREIAGRYASGETHTAIATALSLSRATVRNHLANCFRKLAVNNKVELARRLLGSG